MGNTFKLRAPLTWEHWALIAIHGVGCTAVALLGIAAMILVGR